LAESPAKKSKDLKFLAKFPPSLKLLKPDDNVPKDLKSPIPLPPGVSNIDPEDDGNNPYGRDHHHYLEKLQTELRPCKESIIESIEDETFRKKLVEWLLHVAHHFRCSQETFYHTVDLLDRFLSSKKVKKEHLQLVGIACYLIATKLDEYYPADLKKLHELSGKAFTPEDITDAERIILISLEFRSYGADVMPYVNRFLRAAYIVHEKIVYELTIFGMDFLSLDLDHWCEPHSKKAAASILSAMMVHWPLKTIEELWTPNLKYYTGFEDVKDIISMTRDILKGIGKALQDEKHEYSLTTKYNSVSRHEGLLSKIDGSMVYAAIQYSDGILEEMDNSGVFY